MKKLKNASVENVDAKLLWDTKETTKADVSDHRVSVWPPSRPSDMFPCFQIIILIKYYLTKILRKKRIIREYRQRRY